MATRVGWFPIGFGKSLLSILGEQLISVDGGEIKVDVRQDKRKELKETSDEVGKNW